MDNPMQLYAMAVLGWTALQSLPLILFPSLISTLLSPPATSSSGECTYLETYYARMLGLSQLTIGLFAFVLSGFLSLEEKDQPSPDSSHGGSGSSTATTSPHPSSPYAQAGVLVSTVYHASCTFYLYARTFSGADNLTAYILGCAGNGVICAFGLWVLLFAGETARISKRTGADKRTSGFPFGNKEADRKKVGRKHL